MAINGIAGVHINGESKNILSDMLHNWVDFILEEADYLVLIDENAKGYPFISVEVRFPKTDGGESDD